MKKKYKLKKEFRYLLCGILCLIVIIFMGRSIYNDHIYKNSYEYKLENHGYTEKEVKLLVKELDNKKLDKLLKSKKDPVIISFIKEKYYIKKNLDRYLEYYNKNKKMSIKDIVAIVNVNADYETYEKDHESDINKNELVLCNKYYKLLESYSPDDIVDMKNKYYYGEVQKIRQVAYDSFIDMWTAANEEGIYLIVNSSYRTFKEQEEVYNNYKDSYGEKEADSIASRPGYSEHQTGLALDIFSKDNTSTKTFKDSLAYEWLKNNSYKYGFILRYPEGKESLTKYNPEAWHYRYVGLKAAKYIYDNKITFDEYYAFFVDKK